MMLFRAFIAAGLAVAFGVTAADAQAPGGQGGPAIAVNPQALPGDFFDTPRSGQLHVPLSAPKGPRPNRPQPPAPVSSLSFTLALQAAQTALNSCAAQGYKVAVAVTDSNGDLKAALSPDGVEPNRVYMALHKDVTVAAFKMSTLDLRKKIATDPSLMAQVKPNMALLPGGLPIMKNGQLVGAIAASGATADIEEDCGKAGIAKIQDQL